MDALIRYQRMRGFNTLWQPGTDHAGIATQMVVERQLNAAGQSRIDLGREAFVARVWEWKEKSGGTIAQSDAPPRRLGRLDPRPLHHGPGLVARRDRSVRAPARGRPDLSRQAPGELGPGAGRPLCPTSKWCPRRKTASLWHLRYPLADGAGYLVVATTRPETMLGDSAVAVHPEDERYRHLIGRRVRLPLTGARNSDHRRCLRRPCVRQRLRQDHARTRFQRLRGGCAPRPAQINIMTPDAALNDAVPGAPTAAWIDSPRAKRWSPIWQALGLVERIEPHKLTVPRGDRTRAIFEPLLTDQWFVNIKPLAEPAHARRRRWPHPLRPRTTGPPSTTSGCATSRTGASAGSSGGGTASRPGTTTAGRCYVGARRGRGARAARPRATVHAAPGRGRARHLVLLGTVAVLHAGLAGRHAGAAHAFTRRRCWSPASTSFSSGSRG